LGFYEKFSTLIFSEEHGHYFSISFDLLVHPYHISSYFIPMEVQKTKIKTFPMKHDLSNGIRQNIKETQNIQKSMVKKKNGRQCLPMTRRQCKEEKKKRGSTVNGGST